MIIKRIVRKVGTVCGLCVLLLSLPGCWDYQRINYRDQVIGIGVDPIPGNQKEMLFTFQVPLFGKSGTNQSGQGEEKSSTASSTKDYQNYKVMGESFNEALSKAQTESDRVFFVGNVETIVLNRHLNGGQIQGLISEFVRTLQMNSITSVVATPDSASGLLQVEGEAAPAEIINRYDEGVKQVAFKTRRKLWEFWRDLNAAGVEPVVGIVTPRENGLKIAGTMVFKNAEPKEELDKKDTLSYNLLIGKAQRFSLLIHDGNLRSFSVYIIKSRSKQRAILLAGKQTKLVSEIHIWGIVEQDESKGMQELTKQEMERYEGVMEREIQTQILKTVSLLQRDRADVVGFGRQLLYKNPALEHNISTHWDEQFSKAHVDILVKVSLIQKGRLI